MIQITDVVKKLIIVNVALFFITEYIFTPGGRALMLHGPGTGGFMPVQIVTHMFMHGGTQHLIFNMITLFFFGPRVESTWGPKKFFLFYIICGLGSLAGYMGYEYFINGNTSYYLLGASGAINGVLMAFALMYPNDRISLIFPPISGKAIYFVLGFLAIDIFAGISGARTGIAHFAHVGGAMIGFCLVMFWKSKKQLFDKWD